jgi:hypothetical protein
MDAWQQACRDNATCLTTGASSSYPEYQGMKAANIDLPRIRPFSIAIRRLPKKAS